MRLLRQKRVCVSSVAIKHALRHDAAPWQFPGVSDRLPVCRPSERQRAWNNVLAGARKVVSPGLPADSSLSVGQSPIERLGCGRLAPTGGRRSGPKVHQMSRKNVSSRPFRGLRWMNLWTLENNRRPDVTVKTVSL